MVLGMGHWIPSNMKLLVLIVRPAQIVADNRLLVSATCHLAHLKGVLKPQRILASMFVAAQSIWNQGGLLALFRGTSMILEKWGFNLDEPDPNFSFRRSRPNPYYAGYSGEQTITPQMNEKGSFES
ncbi:uncharacterized protein LOC141710958 [Apium graveolens]|uniref:uncharacterized protein LOC141710958 n=1 Tax=Apium graveolens TaxID=4045 RepID=UPI003D7A41DB